MPLDHPPAVVLVRPREEGNVGAVARAMANMGLDELILIEPAPALGGVARGFGIGGWHVLDTARRARDLAAVLAPFHRAVGTSSGRDRPLRQRQVVEARQLPPLLGDSERIALVFGTEGSGLTRAELDLCDPLVQIPCAAEHPTLNLAQAVLLVAYEFQLAGRAEARRVESGRAESREAQRATGVATVGERNQLLERCRPLLEVLGFDQPHLQGSMVRDLRRLLQRAEPDSRQVGVVRRVVERVLERLGEPQQTGSRPRG